MPSGTTKERPAAWSIVEEEPLAANIQALLDDAAIRHPAHTLWHAIDGDSLLLSYDEFRRLSVVCAQKLEKMGVRKGTHVALMMPNVAAFLICWIALCRLGAVAVMVNTASTSSELERLIRETQVDFLVIDRQYLNAYDGLPPGSRFDEKHLVLHGTADPATTYPTATAWSSLIEGVEDPGTPMPEVSLDDIAGILFTSGSSGVPKACMLSHRYWLTLAKARSAVGPAPTNILIDTPMFYMGPLWKIMMGIGCGAIFHVAARFSLSRLFDRIIDHGVDFCTVTSPAAKLDRDPRFENASLKWLATYGLTKELHAGLEQRLRVPVREIYGLTEVGSALSMPVEDDSMVGSGSCGLPVPFRRCKLMANGKEVLDGTPGELWIAGSGLFSGYYRNPEATDAAFEGEWFRTGDLFRRDAKGYYFMLGRIKDVIRRSSENISATEVELAVTAIDGVLEAAAVPVPDPLRGEEVKVVIARAPNEAGAQLTPERVVRECRQVLSAYKVPRYVEFMAALPKTASAKIDKARLKAAASVLNAEIYDATLRNERNK